MSQSSDSGGSPALDSPDPCPSTPCQSIMLPTLPSVNTSLSAKPDHVQTFTEYELERIRFYASYSVWTGINIAASLGGFFLLLILVLLYKSKCKRSSKRPLCPSAEDREMGNLQESWGEYINDPHGIVRDALSRDSAMSRTNSERSQQDSVREWRRSPRSGSARSAPGSVARLQRRARLSSGGSTSIEGGDTQVELTVYHPGRPRKPMRFATSFDEQAANLDGWWQRVDINVIQPTPIGTPSLSAGCTDEVRPTPQTGAIPRLNLPPPSRLSAVSSSEITDPDARSIGSDSVFLADDDWSSCSESPRAHSARRRSMLSRQSSMCIEDDLMPDTVDGSRTEVVCVPGLPSDRLHAVQPDGGNSPYSSSTSSGNFLTVPGVHASRTPPTPRRSSNFLAPPPLSFGPGRPTSPPPASSSDRTCIDLSSPDRPPPVRLGSSCQCPVGRPTLSSKSSNRKPKLAQLRSRSVALSDRNWCSTDSMNQAGGPSVRRKKMVGSSSFDAHPLNPDECCRFMGSAPSLVSRPRVRVALPVQERRGKARQPSCFTDAASIHHNSPVPSIKIDSPVVESPDDIITQTDLMASERSS